MVSPIIASLQPTISLKCLEHNTKLEMAKAKSKKNRATDSIFLIDGAREVAAGCWCCCSRSDEEVEETQTGGMSKVFK